MKSDKIPYEELARELSGEATAEEQKRIRQWVESSEEAREEYESFTDIWKERYFVQEDKPIINQDEVADKIWDETFEQRKKTAPKWTIPLQVIAKVAAVLVLVFSLGYYGYVHVASDSAALRVVTIEKKTLPGQKSMITLPDGSVVWLNAGSKITYTSDFGVHHRNLRLSGQAFFDVFKDKSKPFVVRCKDLEVEALGTSFDINAYQQKQVKVSLLTGKVRVSPGKKKEEQHVLLPGEYSIVDENNHVVEKGKFDSGLATAWKEGKLIFRDMTLDEMIPILELWYGVQIENKTRMKTQKHFNGTFERESLSNILENMGLSMGFESEKNGNKVILK